MNKSLKILAFLIIVAIMPAISYADDIKVTKDEAKFLTANKLEASPGDVITLTVNLSNINYENFEFSLNTNNSIDNITVDNNDILDTKLDENTLKIISSKSNLTMEKLELYYKIPDDIALESTIVLKGAIKKVNIIDQNNDLEDESDNKESESSQEVEISIKIVESKEESDKEDGNNFDQDIKKDDEKKEESEKSKNQNNTNEQKNNSIIEIQSNIVKSVALQVAADKNISSESSNKESQISYEGNNNNYLSSLTIDGYDLNTSFKKTNTTYFINVDNNVSNININAIAEDDSAKVTVYGNNNIKSGKNKVLISVTSENGNVRFYRVFVNK